MKEKVLIGAVAVLGLVVVAMGAKLVMHARARQAAQPAQPSQMPES